MPLRILLVAVAQAVVTVKGDVSFPGVEFNAAVGEPAYASSYYNYAPNALYDTVFVPGNANDGFPDETSWWSAGDNASEEVFWQANMSALVPTLSRIVVRWHGFLSPRSYRIRVSYDGVDFTSIIAVFNLSNAYDRVDNHTEGLAALTSKFRYVRVVIGEPNVCSDQYSCTDDGVSSTTSSTNERVIYGIREVEVWAKGTRSGALRLSGMERGPIVVGVLLSALLMAGYSVV
ncbi:RxLR-like protein [Phytophthora cinnamomi]|uniref:RxLR-like protein n=1 Tax=Phytophthora cinnamomi TaxID=4785 RepID=UPI00355AB6FD|nr:RxLR-like protein [Phytophthora cinnamomi]